MLIVASMFAIGLFVVTETGYSELSPQRYRAIR